MIKKNLLIGIGLSVFLFALSFILYLNFSYLGAKDKEVENLIFGQFKWLLILINLKLLMAYLIIGLIIAAFSLLLKINKIYNILLFNMFFWFMFWVRGIKLLPQLFTEQLYNKGFVLKYFQLLITDFTPLFLVYFIFIATIIAIGIKNKRLPYSFLIIGISLLVIVKFKESSITPSPKLLTAGPMY